MAYATYQIGRKILIVIQNLIGKFRLAQAAIRPLSLTPFLERVMNREPLCSDCEVEAASLTRRRFVQAVGTATLGTTLLSTASLPRIVVAEDAKSAPLTTTQGSAR